MTKPRVPADVIFHSRLFSEHQDATVLPEWLNAAKETRSFQRVAELIKNVKLLEELLPRTIPRTLGRDLTREERQVLKKAERKYSDTESALLRQLGRYQYSARLIQTYPENTYIHAMSASRRAGEFAIQRRDLRTVSESDVVLIICRLAEQGRLDRVRSCDHCGQWMFANPKHRRFCEGGDCKRQWENAARRTDEARQSRREYMRRYRELPQVKKRA